MAHPPEPPNRSAPPEPARTPLELPLVSTDSVRRERGDAAANRARILAAARALLDAHGPAAVSMDAVAAAAGVGKGTVFRRFGDRAGLMGELISEYMRDFQDAFLTGPPPLGPGAPPAERLVAFLDTLVELQREHLPVALAAETRLMDGPPGVYGALYIHTASLIRQIDEDLDADVLAALVLAALAPPVLQRLDADSERVSSAVAILLAGITDRPA